MPSSRSIARFALFVFTVASLLPAPAGAVAERAAPEITAQSWLNSPPLTIGALRGKVALVEFWTFACFNCQHVEPVLKRWHERYAERGLVIVGVHTPELPIEKDPERVAAYVREHGIHYPVAIDPSFATWERYDNRAWPALYLVDKRGIIRHVHVGEGGYDETEQRIEALLAETGEPPRP